MAENKMIRIGGLWVQENNGKKYMAGNLSATSRLLLFRNDKKSGEKDPDYILYVAQPRKQNQQNDSNQSEDEFMN